MMRPRGSAPSASPDAQADAVAALRDDLPAHARTPIEFADLQDALEDWLGAHDVDGVDAEPLAVGARPGRPRHARRRRWAWTRVGVVLAHESAQRAVRQLAMEIETAASRIHSLVAAVKGFTYVNQQATLMPIAIGQGLSDTITVLRSKARTKSVDVELQRRRASARRRGLRWRAEPGVGEPGGQRHRRHAGRSRACRRRERRRHRHRARHRRRAGHSADVAAASSTRSSRPRISARGRASASTSPAASSNGITAPST